MKNFFFVLILLLLGNGAIAQTNQSCSTCLPEGITFNTQAQIDNFQTNYPKCTEILGGVTIYGNDIANLNGLSGLISIGGSLTIGDWDSGGNPSLTSLTGLDNLTSIGDYLSINGNALTSLTGLENVTSIGGGLYIFANDALTSLTGLDNISGGSISDLYIYENVLLSTCAIQSICDYLAAPNGTVEIQYNANGCNSQEEVDSACVYLSTGELNLQSALSLYPNPSSTTITLELPNITTPNKNTILTIFNLNGQQLIRRPITEPQTVVDISGLNAGIYFVKVMSDDGVMVGKFVKN